MKIFVRCHPVGFAASQRLRLLLCACCLVYCTPVATAYCASLSASPPAVAFKVTRWVPLPAQAPRSPVMQAKAFYEWYLSVLKAGHDPMSDEPKVFATFVTTQRARSLKRLRDSDDLDSDYFIQAQDWLVSWPKAVSVTAGKQTATTSAVDVVLGTGSERHRLRVTLVLQQNSWRVSTVSRI